jgi:hypothetical protein
MAKTVAVRDHDVVTAATHSHSGRSATSINIVNEPTPDDILKIVGLSVSPFGAPVNFYSPK